MSCEIMLGLYAALIHSTNSNFYTVVNYDQHVLYVKLPTSEDLNACDPIWPAVNLQSSNKS